MLSSELAPLLRPAGGGVYTVSTGRAAQIDLQRRLYDARDEAEVDGKWRAAVDAAARARVVVLGVPSDAGAGIVRGAAHGPAGIRRALLARDPTFFAQPDLCDVGDVLCVPQLLEDEMLSEAQKQRTRAALYAAAPAAVRATLPVSPLDIAHHVLARLLAENPALRVLLLGGDHSVSWPLVRAVADAEDAAGRAGRWGIVHFDAHTDLLAERLGVRHCFATWAYHANQRLGGQGRLVQIGIRASGRDRAHWESSQGVRQFWAADVTMQEATAVVTAVVAHLRAAGVERVYISNDIDGTDVAAAPATGTPEPGGLSPAFVLQVIDALAEAFPVVAADMVEVAPPVGDPAGAALTCDVAASYVQAMVAAMLRSGREGP